MMHFFQKHSTMNIQGQFWHDWILCGGMISRQFLLPLFHFLPRFRSNHCTHHLVSWSLLGVQAVQKSWVDY
jgi:hypothetical protein